MKPGHSLDGQFALSGGTMIYSHSWRAVQAEHFRSAIVATGPVKPIERRQQSHNFRHYMARVHGYTVKKSRKTRGAPAMKSNLAGKDEKRASSLLSVACVPLIIRAQKASCHKVKGDKRLQKIATIKKRGAA